MPQHHCKTARVLIADDEEFFALGAKTALESASFADLSVKVEYQVIEKILHKNKLDNFDVLILDLDWHGEQEAGLQAIPKLKTIKPDLRIIAISNFPNLVSEARKVGAEIARPKKGLTGERLIELINLALELPPTQVSVSDDDPVALKGLLKTHYRRLAVLEKQQAKLGLHTPPHIIIEVEDIKETIRQLEEKLRGKEI
jgi:DNA-binding NarL/FixJ family response regulator